MTAVKSVMPETFSDLVPLHRFAVKNYGLFPAEVLLGSLLRSASKLCGHEVLHFDDLRGCPELGTTALPPAMKRHLLAAILLLAESPKFHAEFPELATLADDLCKRADYGER